jgi:hypothetical protein
MQLLKGIVGALVGYAVFAVSAVVWFRISGRDPHQAQALGFMVLSVAYGMIFATAGGHAAAAIAGRRPRVYGGVVALLIASGATVSLLAQPGSGALWSQLTALTLMAPAAFAGGVVWSWSRRRET